MDHQQEWRATMHGERGPAGVVLAHRSSAPLRIHPQQLTRVQREEAEARLLAEGATAASGAGQRATEEAPDEFRTCFERDRDRILHSSAFRRLAGKTQVFIFPEDHQRTRLTHALEVAQVATSISRALGLNIALTEAIALGHDCGHGPGGHASEEALSPYISGGYHHAVWGADVALAPLNLCLETLDGIRNHSWSRPAPITPEGEVVSWADRFAYCTADLDDALRAGIVDASMIPPIVGERLGRRQSQQIDALVTALISCVQTTGTIGVDEQSATALAALRAFNYTYIYTRPESTAQGEAVIEVLRALVETYIAHPGLIPPHVEAAPHSEMSNEDTATRAVAYVAGMTDRFAFGTAAELLGWPASKMPVGIDLRLFAGDDADDLPVTA